MAIQRGRRGRRDFQAVAVAADEGAAADVALDEAFGFEFGVGVGDGGAMNAEHDARVHGWRECGRRGEDRRRGRGNEVGRAVGCRGGCGFRAEGVMAALSLTLEVF